MKCPMCSAEAPSGAAYCQDCGAKLPAFEDAGAAGAAESTSGPERFDSTSSSGSRRDSPEETLWEGSYSPKAMLGIFAGCGILTIALVAGAILTGGTAMLVLLALVPLVWLVAGLRLAAKRLGISYKLTNHMFYHRKGVLTRVTDRIELIEVHDVTWKQGLFERLVDVGTVTITSADRTHPKLPLHGIENVEAVAQKIDRARRAEQLRRGRRIDFSNIDGQT